MDEALLKTYALEIIAIADNLNKAKRHIQTKDIDGPAALKNNHTTYLALKTLAHNTYETVAQCMLFNHTLRNKVGSRRTQLSHVKKRLTTASVVGKDGIDTITEEDFWNTDLAPTGYLEEIGPEITVILQSHLDLESEIDKQRSDKCRQPITTLLTQSDFSHAKLTSQISTALEDGIICLVGFLTLLENDTPSKKELFEATQKLIPLSQEQFDFAVSQLEGKNILKHSTSGNYLMILDKAFCKNTTVDFLEKYDVTTIMKKLGGAS